MGGLATLNYLSTLFPHEDYLYLADEAHFPYGDKSTEVLVEIAKQNIKYLLSKKVKMIVIACNTISSLIDQLKDTVEIPLFDVITPTTNKIKKTQNIQTILLLGTAVTVNSKGYERLLPNYHLKGFICSEFASLVEKGDIDSPIIEETLRLAPECDIVILGCTHYSFLKKNVEKVFPKSLLFDSAYEVIHDVEHYLRVNNLFNPQSKKGTITFMLKMH